jgi:2-polyprenyl-3-methyl-5-hydroxy-6-metoxy-1,4-benzoquinol methylase
MTQIVAMPSATRSVAESQSRQIEYLSPPAPVSMADCWFEIASLEHFWIRRRFEVLQRLDDGLVRSAAQIAEIGCGNGLVQRQVEDHYGKAVTGFDLNEYALKQNLSTGSRLCCYDIHEQLPALHQSFDLMFLFDVLEHLPEETRFLNAVLYHLAPQGKLIINVPAGQWAFSAYDKAAGHFRRYSIEHLREVAHRSNLQIQSWTYWGLPLVPTLAIRKLWLIGRHDQSKTISSGFGFRSLAINHLLSLLSRCEILPQKRLGTSLMAILQRSGATG